MISHSEAVNVWLGAFGTAAFIGGLLSGHWWWPSRERLEDERDEGRGEIIDQAIERVEREGMVFRLSPNGKAVWCDAGSQWDLDGAQRALSFDDGDELQSGFKNVSEGSDHAPMPRPGVRGAGSVRDAGMPPALVPGAASGQERGLRGVEGSAGSASASGGDGTGDRLDDSLSDPVRPAGPSPAAGRTYSELVMLAAQDTPGPLDDALTAPVDPGWYPEALRRSEDWLAARRAELGLVAS